MNNYTVFDTACGSLNVGDQIIMNSFNNEMRFLLDEGFCARFPTHTPVTHFYQNTKLNHTIRYINSSKYKFVAGTNILCKNLFFPWPNWNINIFNCMPYKDCIFVGCGTGKGEKINFYTRSIYKKILNKEIFHSTRDEKTKIELEKMGIKAINTGCVTTWCLTSEHCEKIPIQKSKKAIFTLTDYVKDKEKDEQLIKILKDNYDEIYYWVQGSQDLEYFKSLNNIKNINIVAPSLEAYREVLQKGNIDYIGTRLHAGIFAMQNYCRSIIIIVDNRARDMNKNYNLNCIERDNISDLNNMINSEFKTKIDININEINRWKEQFKV